ncbi:MAG: (d)CMP kinase [Acidipropionibacterium acidipropionici]|jgi:cytidylate kinase|uniref:Cytidylate kinase n=2 Tax=Acidipropionibacterium acidipropionici TaxID=1748 RepID=K7S4L9_ACIA4|nr:(d)CMP kinase [Acidipropionibacterium acidipropionici]AFV89552.1 Cytidylate kinase [Acidipropionibacterium acidipropionici ATCC 4875]APZ08253.1 cytidylate kinase [Acidipropionibacterium acidipropionici]AZP37995.1 (d)CMP kinase [Acidipropionibacterium acidipropionici]QCV95026.1 (d)CMP kinase [Acidipropionibacterium acidipropionici]
MRARPSSNPPAPSELVIAIDGPSGVGKSTTSRALAERLGLAHLDTGSMYRAAAAAVVGRGVDPVADPQAVIDLVRDARLEVSTVPGHDRVAIGGVDVTARIREPEISAVVSKVSTIQPVRDLLIERMRQLVAQCGRRIVVEGRDITTVVCPDAEVRVLLVADPAVRVARRSAELKGAVSRGQVADQVIRRDHDDSAVASFEAPAPGVTVIDSTSLTPEQVVAAVIDLVPAGGQTRSRT